MTQHTPAEVGQAVRSALVEGSVSQVRLASHLGLSRAAVTRRISGDVEFTASQISAVSMLTGVPSQHLLAPAARESALAVGAKVGQPGAKKHQGGEQQDKSRHDTGSQIAAEHAGKDQDNQNQVGDSRDRSNRTSKSLPTSAINSTVAKKDQKEASSDEANQQEEQRVHSRIVTTPSSPLGEALAEARE